MTLLLNVPVLRSISVCGEIFNAVRLLKHIASLDIIAVVLVERRLDKIVQGFSVKIEEKHEEQTYISNQPRSQNF